MVCARLVRERRRARSRGFTHQRLWRRPGGWLISRYFPPLRRRKGEDFAAPLGRACSRVRRASDFDLPFGVSPTRRPLTACASRRASGFHPPAGSDGVSHTAPTGQVSGFHPPGAGQPEARAASSGFHPPGAGLDRSCRGFTHPPACGRPRGNGHRRGGVSPARVTGERTPTDGASPTPLPPKSVSLRAFSRLCGGLTTLTFLLTKSLTDGGEARRPKGHGRALRPPLAGL